jgi:hypothetical protein
MKIGDRKSRIAFEGSEMGHLDKAIEPLVGRSERPLSCI